MYGHNAGQPVIYLSIRSKLSGEFDLCGPSSGNKPPVLGEALEGVDSVVHGSLNVVHYVVCRPSYLQQRATPS